MASTVHGEPRMTADVDVALQLPEAVVDDLAAALDDAFFVQLESLRRAALHHGSFNAVHKTSMVRIDVYVRPDEGLYASELVRAVPVQVGLAPDDVLRIATPEDVGGRMVAQRFSAALRATTRSSRSAFCFA